MVRWWHNINMGKRTAERAPRGAFCLAHRVACPTGACPFWFCSGAASAACVVRGPPIAVATSSRPTHPVVCGCGVCATWGLPALLCAFPPPPSGSTHSRCAFPPPLPLSPLLVEMTKSATHDMKRWIMILVAWQRERLTIVPRTSYLIMCKCSTAASDLMVSSRGVFTPLWS